MNKHTSFESWGSRLSGSIKGVLFGFILFLLSFVMIWWNEGRAVKTAEGLNEGVAIVTSIFSGDINPKYEGQLVHIVDKVISPDTIFDYDFNITSTGLKLKRTVEMYQWTEETDSKKDKNVGGSETTTTYYDYKKKWSNDLINSDDFEVKDAYINPNFFPYEKIEYKVDNPTIGTFDFPDNLLNKMDDYHSIDLRKYKSILPNSKISSNTIFIGKGTVQAPNIGDVKITFSEVLESKVSVISQQSGNTLIPYKTENNSIICLLEKGEVAPKAMFETAQNRNSTLTWGLRFIGFLMMYFGISKSFQPFVVLAYVIPILGRLLSSGVSLFSGVISFTLTLTTIAIAWVFYRPILAFTLLAIAAGALVFIFIKTKKEKSEF